MSRVATGTTIFVNIAAIGGLAVGGYLWLNHRIDAVVALRLKPYTCMINGSLAAEREEYESAIVLYDQALQLLTSLGDEAGRRDALKTLCSSYLYALSNAPEKHSAEFEKVSDVFRQKQLSLEPDQFINMGWYYLRIGGSERARELFDNAVRLSLVRDDHSNAADAYHGLYCAALTSGDIQSAIRNFYEGAARSTDGFSLYWDPESGDYKRFCRIYPKFQNTVEQFYQKVAGEKPAPAKAPKLESTAKRRSP